MTKPEIITVLYVNDLGEELPIVLSIENQLGNLMEIIRDYGYQEWGECRGRAWCRSCHVAVDRLLEDIIPPEEDFALDELPARTSFSRLACQIPIDKNLDGVKLTYQGDN